MGIASTILCELINVAFNELAEACCTKQLKADYPIGSVNLFLYCCGLQAACASAREEKGGAGTRPGMCQEGISRLKDHCYLSLPQRAYVGCWVCPLSDGNLRHALTASFLET